MKKLIISLLLISFKTVLSMELSEIEQFVFEEYGTFNVGDLLVTLQKHRLDSLMAEAKNSHLSQDALNVLSKLCKKPNFKIKNQHIRQELARLGLIDSNDKPVQVVINHFKK
ncbi:hypothetical protein M1446_04580 [Candidatus Dependentiae bacterium]|nr:hypothetical protein [Candidatus Dependentiae bacterium]